MNFSGRLVTECGFSGRDVRDRIVSGSTSAYRSSDMPSRSSAALLFAEIFAHFGAGMQDGASSHSEDARSFRLVLAHDVSVRVDYDDEDELIWLTTPLIVESSKALESWLPALLRLNYTGTAQGLARSIDPDTGAVFLQSRLEGTVVHFADFEVALNVHVEAIGLTRRQIEASPGDSPDAGATQRGSAADSLAQQHGPIIWG
jgi:hypothetical protein